MKCIIVEDNPRDLELLRWYVTAEPTLELKECFSNGIEAISYINSFQPPLLFMDIDMPGIKGLDLYKKLNYKPLCIFVTAFSDYALESYEAQAFDFILKPVTDTRFKQCVSRLMEYTSLQQRADLYDALFEEKTILIKEGTTTHQIPLSTILYIEALSDYSKIVTRSKKYITLSKLKHLLEKLPGSDFIRIHRSYAVAKQAIEKISNSDVSIGDLQLPIGKTFRTHLKSSFV